MQAKLRAIYPPDPNPRKPRVPLPIKTCDTHFHVFAPPDLFPYSQKRGYTPSIAPIEHYLGVAKHLGIERGVLVNPLRIYGSDYRATLAAMQIAKAHKFPLRAILTMDKGDPELTRSDFEHLHEQGVRGIRLNFTRHAFGSFDVELLHRAIESISFLDWCIELHMDSDYIAQHADILRRIELPIIFDQLAHLDGLSDPAFPIVAELLARGNVWIKCACFERFMTFQKRTYEDVVALARALVNEAEHRIIWGTDWPHTQRYEPGLTPNDGDLVDMMLDIVPDEKMRNAIFVENPASLFGFDD